MKNIYYYANNIYQFSYALPVYKRLGGIFVVRDRRRYWHFKRYFINLAEFNEKTFLNTPEVIVRPRSELHKLEGVIFFLANSIKPEYDYNKSTTIFYEHGTSDKRYGGKSHEKAKRKLSKYDHIFLSGPKNKKRLEEVGLFFINGKNVEIGGLRFDEYLKDNYSKEKEMKRLHIKDTSRKNILYAPTWRFGNGTLKKYAMKFAKEITKKHNLIIRPHYHDNKYSYLYKAKCFLQGIKHVYFSNASNIIKQDTFNDFVLADLMISDMSSVIYEFLITEKPMIIVHNDFENYHKMPQNMDIRKNADIYKETDDILEIIDRNLTNPQYCNAYHKMVRDCFYVDGSSVDRAVKFIKEKVNTR